MIGKRLGSSLPARIKRSFADSVCIMAGYPSMDHVGARFMKGLQAKSTEKLEFFGMGGHKMTEAGLSENLGDVSKLKDKPLYIFNNAHPHHRERLYAIYMIAVRYKNYKVIKQIEKELYDMLFEKEPLAFLTLGNEYFMKRLYLMVDKKFQENHHQKKMKPAMLFYDRFMIGQRYDNLKYLDHFIYHTPYNPLNKLFYDFPSTFTGSQGLFDVYQYLYKQHEQYKRLADDSGVYLSLESNDIVMDNLIMHSRSAFRQKHSIPDSATVFFGSVGSNEQEVKWAGNLFCKGVNMFLDKYSKVSADNFVAILSVPEGMLGSYRSRSPRWTVPVSESEVQADRNDRQRNQIWSYERTLGVIRPVIWQ